MIRFLLKGLFRDRQRSLMPVIVVSLGVMLTVLFHSWINGIMGESTDFNARFTTGHVKVMTRSYAGNLEQNPNDLSIVGVNDLLVNLEKEYPDISWVDRIKFGGLIDVPDDKGETRSQGPAAGIAIDILSGGSYEAERMNITNSIIRGSIPQRQGEVLLSEEFSQKLQVNPGDQISLISSTMFGSLSISNFQVSGTVRFGTRILDKGAIIADIQDIRKALDMDDAAGEILGFFPEGFYIDEKADEMKNEFNALYSDPEDEFSPVMLSLRDQSNLASILDYAESMRSVLILIFIIVMSIVLWNAGLISGLRRYGEIGVRLAMGENKSQIYRSLIVESVGIGIAGSVAGTFIGLLFAFILQEKGINAGDMLNNASIMMPSTFHARITPESWYIGFIPGLFSTVFGTSLSGIGVYKRKTASLFKELET